MTQTDVDEFYKSHIKREIILQAKMPLIQSMIPLRNFLNNFGPDNEIEKICGLIGDAIRSLKKEQV